MLGARGVTGLDDAGLGKRDFMAYYSNHNLAYDFTLFEEPRKAHAPSARGKKKVEDRPVGTDSKQKVNQAADSRSSSRRRSGIRIFKRRKSNFLRIGAAVLYGLAVAVIIAAIIHGHVEHTELNQQISDARAQLSEKQSIYTQLEMKVDSSISTATVEQFAVENLHMSKATNSQKEFISLSEGDKAEVYLSEDKNLFEKIIDAIRSIWS